MRASFLVGLHWAILLAWVAGAPPALAQPTVLGAAPAVAAPLSLPECVRYALQNQPLVRQARIDEQVNEADIRIGLAGWLPQVGLTGNAQRAFQLPFVVLPNAEGGLSPRQVGLINTSTFTLSGTQAIYNQDVWLARRQAGPSREFARQNTALVRTNLVSNVSRTFYDVLLAQQQVRVYESDLVRLSRGLKDARARYEAGVNDKIDFKQAEISLNTSRAARKQAQESVKASTARLKELMGLPGAQPLAVQYDSARLELEAALDTTTGLEPGNRLEIRLLQTQKVLQSAQIGYYRWGFLPELEAYGSYNTTFQNNNLGDLYSRRFPSSFAGLQLNLPILQGGRRLQNLRRARLLDQRLDEDVTATRNQINTEFEQALASYKSFYADYQYGKQNLALAREVFDVVNLQYREGIKPYLDVLVAQTTLRSAELTYNVALFQVLTSKVEVLRARGELEVE
ncbi:Outer membrane protein TolC [Hymenobacter arizonensis]|uniref:Outer membrane protein TolC n=1 Tax=Hymenobacter arizonensis TaxID=1227077 RepID=A0A1I5ZNK4_HYMAR|nr:Outer membrane protein TolC [Hymenobacter arizonensis]